MTRSRTCDSLELHLTTLTSWVAGAVYIKIIQLRIIEWKAPECIIITLINTLYRIAYIAEKNAFCQKYAASNSIFDYKALQPFYIIGYIQFDWTE